MATASELVRRQVFFRKELEERVHWFIRLRWGVIGVGLIGLAAAPGLSLDLPRIPLLLVILFILLYNIIFSLIGRRLVQTEDTNSHPVEIFAHFQISLDLLALTLAIFFTGGLASPILIFYIFHVILAGILLSPSSCFIYAILTQLALGVLGIIQARGLTPAWAILPSGLLFPSSEGPWGEVIISYSAFAAGILITAYLVTSIKVALQRKGRELMTVSRALEISNAKLTSLYQMIKEVSTQGDLKALMDRATESAARIMGVRACSIKLLDPDASCLRFASTFGLSETYLSKDCISVDGSEINRRIIAGWPYSIGRIDDASAFQYPEDVRKEGIESMLCLPLKVGDKVLGVFCVYSNEPDFFDEASLEFFSLMTDLTALAMERVQREAAKNWFINRTAHQLRSPLATIQSMIALVLGGFLGPIGDPQKETLSRTQARLAILQNVINDLLTLAAERRTGGPRISLVTVDAAGALRALAPTYQAQAREKGMSIEFKISENLPLVRGQPRMLDDLFSNLISNAIKYTPIGGQVTVSLFSPVSTSVVFEVVDTGIGIPETDQPRLFSEFFRAENAKGLVEEGTGLGLAIVKEIIDRLGGTIKLHSQVGHGTHIACELIAVAG